MPYSVCSSSHRLSQSVRAVVSYLIQNERLILLLINSRTCWAFELSGIDFFRWESSGHHILTRIVCDNYALWTQLDPRFSQSVIKKVVSNSDSANHVSLNMRWYHSFFTITCWPVRYHKIINPKVKHYRVHTECHKSCSLVSIWPSRLPRSSSASLLPYITVDDSHSLAV